MPDQLFRLGDGRALGWAEYGNPNGRPIYCLFGTSSRRFYPFDPSIAVSLCARIITVDRPGIGFSDPKPNRMLLDWPDDLVELADALKVDRFSVIGIGEGGPYAAACAFKLSGRVATLGLVSSLAPPGVGTAFLHRLTPLFARYTERRARQSHEWIRDNPVKAYQKFHQRLPECDLRLVQTLGPRYLKPSFMRDTYDELYRQGIEGMVQDELLLREPWGFTPAEIRTRTGLWHGEADTVASPAMGRHLAETIPDCQARFIPNEGHLLYLKRWEEILAATLEE